MGRYQGGQRPGSGGDRAGQRPESRPDRSDRTPEDRSDRRPEDRPDRGDQLSDRQEDRQVFAKEVQNDRKEYAEMVRDERKWDRDRYRVGYVMTASSFRTLSCSSTPIYVNGVSYYQCGSSWYNRAYSGGSVTYVVVNAPTGY